ncbi:MAG: ThuA domain-containing protein [Phycisphaerae bacterium]
MIRASLTSVALLILLGAGDLGAADAPATRPAGPTLVPVPEAMRKDVPPPRTRAEVAALIGEAPKPDKLRDVHIVLVAGPKDHGPGEHDYPAWQKAWQTLLSQAPRTKVTTAWEKPTADDLKSADALILFKHTAWPKEMNADVAAFLDRGGGVMLLHFAVDCFANPQGGEQFLGLYWGPGAKYRHGWLDLEFTKPADGRDEPLLRGLAGRKLRFHDESYWRLTGSPASIETLAGAMEDDGDGRMIRVPLVWNRRVGKGRVHVNILGHYNWTFNDPAFRVVALRGIAWTAGEPIDRFNDLVGVDVTFRE